MNLFSIKHNRLRISVLFLIIPAIVTNLFAQSEDNWLELSFNYIEHNQLDSAEIALKNVLKNDPAGSLNPFLLNNLGTIQRRLGKQEEALLSYTAALGQYPKNPTFLEGRASLFAEMGRTENALLDYSTLLSVSPDNEEALYQRGLLYLQMKNYELAEDDFRRMLELSPDGLYARMGFASLAKFRGEYEEAEKIYNYLLDKEPEIPGLYAGRAEVYLLMNKPGSAASDISRAIRFSGEENSDPYYYIIRCRAKILLHEKKSALDDLEKALSLGYDAKEAEKLKEIIQ